MNGRYLSYSSRTRWVEDAVGGNEGRDSNCCDILNDCGLISRHVCRRLS